VELRRLDDDQLSRASGYEVGVIADVGDLGASEPLDWPAWDGSARYPGGAGRRADGGG